MNLKVIAILTLSSIVLGYGVVQAEKKPKESLTPIPITLQSSNTGQSYQPKDRARSEKPYSSKDRVIIGADDRTPVLTRAYPWSAIGRVDITTATEGGSCTGTLVGPDIVLTNAHCLIDRETKQPIIARNTPADSPNQIIFKANMVQGESFDKARVIDYRYGTNDYQGKPGDDWAILKLDKPLGKQYGYLQWRALDFSNPKTLQATRDRLTLVGYSGDFPTKNNQEYGEPSETAGMNQGCSIEEVSPEKALAGVFFHRCDSNPGASGGPIFGQFSDGNYYIIGLHSGSNELEQKVPLSNGDMTQFINRGVTVSRWSSAALSYQK
jgi:protease YdgD